MTHNETAGHGVGDGDDCVLQNGGTDSGNNGPSFPFPDKTNLRNGELTREFISCSSYFVNLRDTAEMKEVLIFYVDRKVLWAHFCG